MIKEKREGKHMTQAELARKVKVSQAYIAQLEAGKRKNPSLVLLKEIAAALHVNPGKLLQ